MRLRKQRDVLRSDAEGRLTALMARHFPLGQNYRVYGQAPRDLHHWLAECLGLERAGRSPHRLWGPEAQALSAMGRETAWLLDGVPLAFFTGSVIHETARAVAIRNRHLVPTSNETDEARTLLTQLRIGHLIHRAPDQLSDGETKVLWLALQWAKRPKRLFIDGLAAGLSDATLAQIVDFMLTSAYCPALIIGQREAEQLPMAFTSRWTWKHCNAEALFEQL